MEVKINHMKHNDTSSAAARKSDHGNMFRFSFNVPHSVSTFLCFFVLIFSEREKKLLCLRISFREWCLPFSPY